MHNWCTLNPGKENLHHPEVDTTTKVSPACTQLPPNIIRTQALTLAMELRIYRQLDLGAIEHTNNATFLSPTFLRLKSSGEWRLIFKLKDSQQILTTNPFQNRTTPLPQIHSLSEPPHGQTRHEKCTLDSSHGPRIEEISSVYMEQQILSIQSNGH